ncbi:MAG: hypothetical protein WCK25_06090 [Actinomycetes bacterium]
MARKNRGNSHRPFGMNGSHWRSDGAAKTRYDNERSALDAATYRGGEEGIDLTAYKCDFCSGWHMARMRDE